MDDSKIFGPLTFRQAIYLGLGVFIAYNAYTYLDQKISFPFIAIVAGLTFVMIRNSPVVVIDDNYIKMKRFHAKNLEEFQGWIKGKIALIKIQMQLRNSKNLGPDEKLAKALQMFEDALRDIK